MTVVPGHNRNPGGKSLWAGAAPFLATVCLLWGVGESRLPASPRRTTVLPTTDAARYEAFSRSIAAFPDLLKTGQLASAAALLQRWSAYPETSPRVARMWYAAFGPTVPGGEERFSLQVENARLCLGEIGPGTLAAVRRLLCEYPDHFFWNPTCTDALNEAQRQEFSALVHRGAKSANPFLELAQKLLETDGALPRPRAGPATLRQVDAQVAAGRHFFLRGFAGKALDTWSTAAATARSAGDHWGRIEAETLRIHGLATQNRCGEAETVYREACSSLGAFPLPCLELPLTFARGMLLIRQGNLREAVTVFQDVAIRSARAPGNARTRNATLVNLAYLYDELGEYASALACFEGALTDSATVLAPHAKAVNLLNRGALFDRLGMLASARRDYLGVLALGEGRVPFEVIALTELNLGNLSARERCWAAAEIAYDRAERMFKTLGQTEDALLTRLNRAEMLLLRGDLDAAALALRLAKRDLPDEERGRLGQIRLFLQCCLGLESRDFGSAGRALARLEEVLHGERHGTFQWEIPFLQGRILAGTGRSKEALAAYGQAMDAFDHLQEKCGAEEPQVYFGGLGRELAEAVLEVLWQVPEGAGRSDRWAQQVLDAMEWYRCRVLRKTAGRRLPVSAPAPQVSLQAVRSVLKRRQAGTLIFFQGRRQLYYLAVESLSTTPVIAGALIPVGQGVRPPTAGPVREGPLDLSGAAGEAALEKLFSRGVVSAFLARCRELIVLPDGDLHSQNLEALRVNCGEKKTYLGLCLPMCHLPSWQLFFLSEKDADPTCRFDYCGVFGSGATGSPWPEIPGAEREIRQTVSAFPWECPLIVPGPEAAGGRFTRRLTGARARIFHIASHIQSNEEDPWAGSIVLGKGQATLKSFQVRDLEQLQLKADLVVLSGCRSGRGPVFAGEGVISLARVFLASGCRGVLTTTWEVEDRFGTRFARQFFACLEENGGDAVRALHAARLALSAVPAYRDPIFWANYRLYGIPPRIPMPQRTAWGARVAAVLILLLLPAVYRRQP